MGPSAGTGSVLSDFRGHVKAHWYCLFSPPVTEKKKRQRLKGVNEPLPGDTIRTESVLGLRGASARK